MMEGTAVPAWAAVALIGMVAYLLKSIHGDLKELTKSFNDLAIAIPEKYVAKTEYLDDWRANAADHRRMHERIDSARCAAARKPEDE